MRISWKMGLEVLAGLLGVVFAIGWYVAGHTPSWSDINPFDGEATSQQHHPRHPRAAGLAGIDIVAHLPRGVPDYDREAQFGDWASTGDGCDMRQQILRRDLVDETLYSDGCTVETGTLHDPYTGNTIRFAHEDYDDVQIDHMVPLGLAWYSGAYRWTQGEREAYANDPKVLLAVDGPTNGSKSDQSISEWLPAHHPCGYERHYLRVIRTYDLVITRADARTVRTSRC